MSRMSQIFASIFNGCHYISAAPRDMNATCEHPEASPVDYMSGHSHPPKPPVLWPDERSVRLRSFSWGITQPACDARHATSTRSHVYPLSVLGRPSRRPRAVFLPLAQPSAGLFFSAKKDAMVKAKQPPAESDCRPEHEQGLGNGTPQISA